MVRLRDRPYLLLTLTALFWAGNSVVGRAVVHLIPPVALAQVRWTAAALLLAPFALSHIRKDWPKVRERLGTVLLMAFCGVTAFNTLLYWSLQHTTAINATLMQSSAPLVFGLWSFVLFRDPLTARQFAGIAVSLCGVATIVSGGSLARLITLSLNRGDVAVLVAMVAYGLYTALLRKRPAIAPLSFLALTIAFGALMLAPATAWEFLSGARIAPLTAGSAAALVYVVIFPSILATLFFNRGVELIGANRAGPMLHLIPLFGTTLAIIFLGERPGWHHAVGVALVIAGVVVASRAGGLPGKKRMEAPAGSA